MDRRRFLAASCAAWAAGPRALDLRPAAPVLPPPGLQLYSLRGEVERDLEGTLHRLAALGCREVEFAGYAGRTPAQVRAALRAAGLSAPAAHVPLESLEGEAFGATAEAARVAGHEWVVVAWLPAAIRGTLDAWRALADRFNAIGQALAGRGLRFAYHNHDFEFAPLQGRVPYEVLLERADPGVVGLELDLYWVTKAGHDPLALVRAHPGRFPLVHVKDASPPPERRQVDVGAGTIDFRAIFAAAAGGIRHAFIEHDEPADPWAFAAASLAAYRDLAR